MTSSLVHVRCTALFRSIWKTRWPQEMMAQNIKAGSKVIAGFDKEAQKIVFEVEQGPEPVKAARKKAAAKDIDLTKEKEGAAAKGEKDTDAPVKEA